MTLKSSNNPPNGEVPLTKSEKGLDRGHQGIVYKEYVPASQTISSTYYCDVLWQLHENVLRLHAKL
jgi:hypothetical protein